MLCWRLCIMCVPGLKDYQTKTWAYWVVVRMLELLHCEFSIAE